MSKHEKLVKRFLEKPKGFKWNELVTMLSGFSYELIKGGKTGGSRVRFVHKELPPVTMHRPHPSSIMKRYQIEQLRIFLQ